MSGAFCCILELLPLGGASGWDSDATVFRRIARRIGRYATRRPRSGTGIGVEVDVRHVGILAQVCGHIKCPHDVTGTELRSKCRQAPTGVALPGGCGTKPWSTGRGRLPVAHQVASQLQDVILRLLEYRRIGPPAARIVVTGTIHGIRSSSSVSKMRTAHDAQDREAWKKSR